MAESTTLTARRSWRAQQSARRQLRSGLGAHLAAQRGARILDEQRAERSALRAARADVAAARASASVADLAADRGPALEVLAARRREDYRAALAYPMAPAEVLAAVRAACDQRCIPAGDDRDETVAQLVAHVIGRHGRQPLRADVGREWLRERARRIYERESQRRERATGMRASAATVAAWAAQDAADSDSDSGGPDAIWYLAAAQPTPAADAHPLSAAQLVERLQLSGRQAGALVLALEADKRVTAALSGAARKSAADARAILRRRFPDADTLRAALRPITAALAAIERCQLIAGRRWQPSGPQRPGPARLPGPVCGCAERPAPGPDLGCYPLAIRLRAGHWSGAPADVLSLIAARMPADERQPQRSDSASGPRPHRAAPGCSAGGLLPHPEPQLSGDGWGFIRRTRSYPTRYRRND